MDNATFDRLPNEEKLKCLLGVAADIFGEQRVRMLYDRLAPVVRDCSGHGQDYEDPRDNYWGGVWQIYRAE
ncbi:MAG TPA: hypothetical protein VN442_02410 [Bryobacteraceae bacterium]|nr:hypothetical protein [Bryobacteraceae bacterium]